MKSRLNQFLSTTRQFVGLQVRYYGVPETLFHDSADQFKECPDVQRYVGTEGDEPPYAATAEKIRDFWRGKGVQPKPNKELKKR